MKGEKSAENVRILYAKNTYDPIVKITDWELRRESLPIDFDPYCPGSLNFFLSHYKRLGAKKDEKLTTTTGEMLEQVYNRKKIFENGDDKLLVNFYTFDNQRNNDVPTKRVCATDYVTTMQHSYRPPFPYLMHRLALPKTPWLENRRFKHEDPRMSDHKFFDEGFACVSRNMQKHKVHRSYSYDFCSGIFGRDDNNKGY